MKLGDVANTLVPAALVVQELGFRLEREFVAGREAWTATYEGQQFVAQNPLSLLGLIVIRQPRRGMGSFRRPNPVVPRSVLA